LLKKLLMYIFTDRMILASNYGCQQQPCMPQHHVITIIIVTQHWQGKALPLFLFCVSVCVFAPLLTKYENDEC
jgi:hypothetical protein